MEEESLLTIKNILCAYSGLGTRGSALRHAIMLAQRHDAWLTGVLRHGQPALERQFYGQIPKAILDQLREQDLVAIGTASALFHEKVSAAGLQDRAEFVNLAYEKDGPLSSFARTFDIVVTGVHSTDTTDAHLSANPDLIALQSGRPVLVVPNGFFADAPADHALVAWDGKRSAARALADALPILTRKTMVTILSVGEPHRHDEDRVLSNLERHGIRATFAHRPKSGPIAATILDVADELQAKLVVMGAFEHSKFAHMIIGGVTTDVIRDTKVPVFLSH